jgi:hypothetical protein
MWHDIFQAYADAVHVAITLQPPPAPQPMSKGDRFAECEARRRTSSLFRTAVGITAWIGALIAPAPRGVAASRSGRPALRGCG